MGSRSVQRQFGWDDFETYREFKEQGKLTVRITEWLHFDDSVEELQNHRSMGGTTDPWLKTGALKIVTDGALGSRTAALNAPYSDDPSTSGIMTIETEKLKAMAIERDRLGFQLAFHAIGDKANHVALDVFESVQRVNPSRDRRDESNTRKWWPRKIFRVLEAECDRLDATGSSDERYSVGRVTDRT